MTIPAEIPSFDLPPTCHFVPVCTRERFAQFSGLDEGIIRGMCERGYLPTIKIGKHSLINMVALIQECLQSYQDIQP